MGCMKVLLFGASGMLGFALHRVLNDCGYEVLGVLRGTKLPSSKWCSGLAYLTSVDVERFEDVARTIETVGPDVVINAVGVRIADWRHPELRRLYAVNSVFPRLLDVVARYQGFHLVHFSTDGVFSGRCGMYTELSLPDATDPYGTSKFLGEPSSERSLVLRTSMVGRGVLRNDSLLDWFLQQSGSVRGFRQTVFSGLPVNEIARVLANRILPRPVALTGLFNLSADPVSKYELLRQIRSAWSAEHIRLEPDDSVSLDRSLDSSLLRSTISYAPAAWGELVADMKSFYQNMDERF